MIAFLMLFLGSNYSLLIWRMKRKLGSAYIPLKIFLVTTGLVLIIFSVFKSSNLVSQTSPSNVHKGTLVKREISLGTNLAGLAYWETEIPFKDLFRLSPQWFGQSPSVWNTNEPEKLDLDANGWVKSLREEAKDHQYTVVATAIPSPRGAYPNSNFIVLYEGEGELDYGLGARKNLSASKPNRDVITLINDETITLKIVKTNPDNYIRNIKILPLQYENNYQKDIFNPKFIEKSKPFKTLRFMDWMQTNNSTQKDWSDRIKLSNATWNGTGAPVEVMVALANKTNSNPWFNLPHQATDDYVRQFAQYVKTHLKPTLKVYVEYSNEVWNDVFKQSKWVEAQGKEAFKNNPKLLGREKLAWYSRRTTEIVGIFREVFANQKERVIGVMSAQAAVLETGQYALKYPWSDGRKTHADYGIKAIAIAPYFGHYLGSPENQTQLEAWTKEPDGGLNKLFQELTLGGVLSGNGVPKGGALLDAYNWISAYSDLATLEGLELIAYEGGSHLAGFWGIENNQAITNLFHQANRDTRLGDIYKQYVTKWSQLGGGLFVNFNDISIYSKWGAWGALENVNQINSPKYNALIKLIQQSN